MYDEQDIKPSRSFDDIDREIRGQQRPPALKPPKPVKSFDDIDREVRSQSSPDVVQYPQNPKVGQTIPLRSGITMTYAGDPKDRPAQPPRGSMGWTGEDTDAQGKPTGRGMVYHKPVAAPGEFKSPINMDFRAPTEAQKMADRALQAPSAFQASRPKSTFERIQDQQALEMRQPQTVETDPIRLAQLQRETAEYQARKQRQQAEATANRNQTLRKIGGALNPAIGLGNALNDAGVPDVNRVLQSGGKSVGSIVRGAAAASTMYPGAEGMYKFITGSSLRDTADRYGRQAERLTNQASEALLPEQEQDQSFRAKIERGAGSMLPPVGAALATGGGSAMAAGVGALANLGQVASERDQSGVPVSDTRRAMSDTMAVATGMTEALGIGRLLNRVGLKTPLIHRVAQMVEEGGQEYAQDYLNDINAKLVAAYDPQRQINDPLAAKRLESAAIGAILGGAGEVADVGAQRIQQQVQNRAAVRSVANERPNLPTDIRPTTLGPTQVTTLPGASPATSAQPTVDAQPHVAQNDFQKHFALRYQNGQFTLDEAIPLEQAPPQNVKALVDVLQGFQTKPDVPPEMAGAARNLLQQVQSRLSQEAPASSVAEPSPAFPRLPEPEGFNARRAKLLGMDVPSEIAINERIAQADKLLGSQNESDQRLGKRILKQSLEEIQKSEGYQGELGQPDDAPKPYTAVRQAIEDRLKPAPKATFNEIASAVESESATENRAQTAPLSEKQTVTGALRAEADAAKIKAAEFEQSGDFANAAQTYDTTHKNLKLLRRKLGIPKTAEDVARINQIDREISAAASNRQRANVQARQMARQANAPTKPVTFLQAQTPEAQNTQPISRNKNADISAPLLRPEAVQNPEGGIPEMPEQNAKQQPSKSFDQIAADVDSETGALQRAIDRSNEREHAMPSEGVGLVSMSPYADMVARNRDAVDRLYQSGMASQEGKEVFRNLREFAAKNGIEARHLHALADDVRNFELEKARWADRGINFSTVQSLDEGTVKLRDSVLEEAKSLPNVERTALEREVAALDALFDDQDATNLLERAAEGDNNAANGFRKVATEYGIGADTIGDLIEARKPNRAPRQNEARTPQSAGRDTRTTQEREPRSATPEEFDLLNRNPATIPTDEFDAHLTAMEKLRNDEIRGIVKLSREDKREMFRQLRNLNEERKFRVQRKELPAKFESRTLPVDKEFVRQSVEKATQPKARETKIDQMVIDEAESLRQEWGILKTFDKSNIQGALDNARVQTSTDPSNKRAGIIYVNSNAKAVIDEIWSANGGAEFSAAVALDTPALEAVADVLRHEASFLDEANAKQVTALADAFSSMVSAKYDGAGLINVDLANHGYLELARNHELFHVWQYGQSQPNNPARKPMDVKWAEKVNGYEKVRATLTEKDYPDNAEDIVREFAAYSATNDLERLGFSKQEAETVATDFLYEYFTQISKQYGAEHLERIGRVSIPARAVAERVRNEVRSTQTTSRTTGESRVGQQEPRSAGSVAVSGIRLPEGTGTGRRSGSETGDPKDATPQTPRTRESVENSPAFKRWFGDSKVVDENGKPLVVYHGTQSPIPIDEIDLGKLDANAMYGPGFYTTQDYNVASGEGGYASEKQAIPFNAPYHGSELVEWPDESKGYYIYNEKGERVTEGGIFRTKDEAEKAAYEWARKDDPNHPHAYPLYLSIKNPFRMDDIISSSDVAKLLGGDGYPKTGHDLYESLFDQVGSKAEVNLLLQAAGFDGITHIGGQNQDRFSSKFANITDAQQEASRRGGNVNATKSGKYKASGHRVWIAFFPEQVKSAIGNRGTFNPSSAKIDAFKPELKRGRASFGELENEPRGQVAASGLGGLQNLFNRKPKAQSPAQPVPLPKNFDLANWTQKFYREAMAAGLNKADRAKYNTAKTLKEKNAVILSAATDPKREQSIFDIIDKADAATGKNDGSALYDALSDATDLMRKTPSERGLKRVGQEVGNALSLPRALQASMDASALLRQGAILTLPPSQWGKAAKATVRMFQAFNTAKYKEIGKEINLHEDAETARESGLYLSTDKSGLLTKKEEDFVSSWADKIPLVKQSEQAYKTYLDSLRMDSFARYKKSIDKAKGLTEEQKQNAYKAAAEWVNVATGRGSLGQTFENLMPTLSKIFFAPRYAASRIQVLNPYTYAKNANTPEGRVVLRNQMSDMVQYAGMVSLTLALASAAGASVELDPEDPDFLKIKVGQTRYDGLAGLQQPMRLFYRVGDALRRRVTGEKAASRQTALDITARYGRSKLAPVPSFFLDYVTGKDFVGRDFEMKRAVLDRVTPLMWKDMADAYEKEGGAGAVKMLPAMFGIGVQNYAEKTGALKGSRFTKEAEGRGLKYDFIRQKVGEPEAIYKQRVERVEGWMSEYGDKLLSHPRYGTLTAAQQEAAIESLRRRIGTQQNATRPRLDSLAPEKVIQSVLKSEATRPKREAGKLWSPPANRP